MLHELPGSDERCQRRWAHRLPSLIDDEAPIGIAVEGKAEVGTRLEHPGLEIDKVRRLDRVGLMVRK